MPKLGVDIFPRPHAHRRACNTLLYLLSFLLHKNLCTSRLQCIYWCATINIFYYCSPPQYVQAFHRLCFTPEKGQKIWWEVNSFLMSTPVIPNLGWALDRLFKTRLNLIFDRLFKAHLDIPKQGIPFQILDTHSQGTNLIFLGKKRFEMKMLV